jgi:beta-alanine--pyruvate transaminase
MQDIMEKENLFQRSKDMSPYFLDGLFSLKDIDGVTDIRGYGMMGGIDLRIDERPGKAGYACFKKLFDAGLSLKATGDCLIVAPPFICEKNHIDEIVEKLRTGISNYMKG